MAVITIYSDFGTQKNSLSQFPLFPHLFPMNWWDHMPWSLFSEYWALSQLFHSPLSLSCIGEGNGNPLQCSCLENPRDGGAWWAAIYGVSQSRTWLKWLSSSRLVIAFLPRSKCLLISWLQSPSAVILEPKVITSLTVSTVSLSICHEVMGTGCHELSFLKVEF